MNAQRPRRPPDRVEALCATTLRALAGDASLHYRGRYFYRGERRISIRAPHLRLPPATTGLADCRAVADGIALRLRYSDPVLHQGLCPADPLERLVFELLEQLRVETLVPAELSGVVANLNRRFERWSRAFFDARLAEGRLGLMFFTVAHMCRSRLAARPVPEDVADYVESTRGRLAAALGVSLSGIRAFRHEQPAFAHHALEIARIVGERLRAEGGAPADRAGDEQDEVAAGLALLLNPEHDETSDDPLAIAISGYSKVFEDAGKSYRVFTTGFDTEVAAVSLVRKALLREYRARLDRRIGEQGINLPRLARAFSRLLARPRTDGWDFGEEEGQVDGRRLAQLVSSPAERRLFRLDRHLPVADCVVSFLVDCSGSMKTHAEPLATLLDILIRALDMAGARTELLGFTTAAWNGGRALNAWVAAGRPPDPGRLNEVCHMVFKTADRSWRRSRTDIAALFKSDLFREGIDGEAVEWACGRMLARSEARRILVVISDGCPADGATALANDAHYLDNHLKEVVARQTRLGGVEVLGLGVGLDLSPYYRRCLAVDMAEVLDNLRLLDIAQFVGGRVRP